MGRGYAIGGPGGEGDGVGPGDTEGDRLAWNDGVDSDFRRSSSIGEELRLRTTSIFSSRLAMLRSRGCSELPFCFSAFFGGTELSINGSTLELESFR